MTRRIVSAFLVGALGSAGCGGGPECSAVFYAPEIKGSFETTSVLFSKASDLLVCLGAQCGPAVEQRVVVAFESPPVPSLFGDAGSTATKSRKVNVTFSTEDPSLGEPRTGNVLRLRYPKNAEGPWSVDVSLRAKVSPSTSCDPAYGTFER